MTATPVLAVCWKWVDRRPDIDPLSGVVHSGDPRFGGVSDADAAALEMALRTAEMWNATVRVVSAGRAHADRALRDALAAGAHEVVRLDMEAQAPSTAIAAALAEVVADAAVVWCGDYSLDRGSGSVPVLVAAHRGAASVLGAVGVEVHGDHLRVTRRLDGGRREVSEVAAPAVVSVEGSVASLRRAGVAAALRAERAPVPVIAGPAVAESPHRPLRPFRPRPRTVPAPQGTSALDRVRQLTGAAQATTAHRAEVIELEPRAAAERLLRELRERGAGVDDT